MILVSRPLQRPAAIPLVILLLSAGAMAARLALAPAGRWKLAMIALPLLIAAGLRWLQLAGELPVRSRRALLPVWIGVASSATATFVLPLELLGVTWALTFLGTSAALFGPCGPRRMAAACFGLLLVGLPLDVPAELIPLLQNTLASAVAGMSLVAGGELTAHDAMLHWPGGQVCVAPECCGLNTWQIAVAWAWFLACAGDLSFRRAAAFVVFAVCLAGLANVLRVVCLVALARRFGTEALEGISHSTVGLVIFMVMWAVLIALWRRWQTDWQPRSAAPTDAHPGRPPSAFC